MKINIFSQNVELLNTQKDIIEKKLLMLEKFTKRFGQETVLDVYVKRVTNRHQEGNIFTLEAKLKIPGKDIFCKQEGTSLEEAVEFLKDDLKRLLIENKEVKQGKWKRLRKLFGFNKSY